jgi:hypothetical protein
MTYILGNITGWVLNFLQMYHWFAYPIFSTIWLLTSLPLHWKKKVFILKMIQKRSIIKNTILNKKNTYRRNPPTHPSSLLLVAVCDIFCIRDCWILLSKSWLLKKKPNDTCICGFTRKLYWSWFDYTIIKPTGKHSLYMDPEIPVKFYPHYAYILKDS